jgi:phosphoribosylanthranilate isomerase
MPDSGGLPGGTGHRVPLEWAADVARHRRVLLAGGLGPEDVAVAIATVQPAGVDASSRLERSPGEKDETLVRDFVRAARTAAAQLEAAAR